MPYSIDDLINGIDSNVDEKLFLQGIWDKVQAEGSYEALFCEYGLDIHASDHRRLSQLVKLFKTTKHELDCLFINAGCDV